MPRACLSRLTPCLLSLCCIVWMVSQRRGQSPVTTPRSDAVGSEDAEDDQWLPSYFSALVNHAKEHWVSLGASALRVDGS